MAESGPRMGLNTSAIDELVRDAQLTSWRKGQRIFDANDTSDLINFVVSGAVKVMCPTGEGNVCVQVVRPGQFFGLNWQPEPGQRRQFTASAFTDSVVAMVSSETMARIIANAPPVSVLRILTYSWRALSGLLHEKCCLLGLRLEERILHELTVLARDFGQDAGDGGLVIDLPVTHADLGEFALASRANVARVMKRLERAGLIGRSGRRILLTNQFLRTRNKQLDRLARSAPRRRVA